MSTLFWRRPSSCLCCMASAKQSIPNFDPDACLRVPPYRSLVRRSAAIGLGAAAACCCPGDLDGRPCEVLCAGSWTLSTLMAWSGLGASGFKSPSRSKPLKGDLAQTHSRGSDDDSLSPKLIAEKSSVGNQGRVSAFIWIYGWKNDRAIREGKAP